MEQAVAALVVVTTLLCVVLTGFTVVRKLRRDRHETLFAGRRARFGRLLLSHDASELEEGLRRVVRARDTQMDLLVVLEGLWPHLDELQRAHVRDAFGASGLGAVVTRQLGSRLPMRRATAALLIGTVSPQGASELVGPLVADGDGDVSLVAVRALAAVADRRAAELLIATLMTGRLEHERIIERLAAPWAVPAMLDALAVGVGTSTARASLARALGLAGDRSAETALRSMLRSGELEERVGAARALGSAGSLSSAPDLEAALESPEWPLRVQAARSLGLLGAVGAVPALAQHLGDQAWWVRSASAEALAVLGEPGHAALRVALSGDDRYARQRAQEALTVHALASDA